MERLEWLDKLIPEGVMLFRAVNKRLPDIIKLYNPITVRRDYALVVEGVVESIPSVVMDKDGDVEKGVQFISIEGDGANRIYYAAIRTRKRPRKMKMGWWIE